MAKRRIRQADVARLAGVSQATVSSVLNNKTDGDVRVSPETTQRIWEAMRKLGYVANPAARRLAGGQNRLLGVFTYEPIFPIEHRNFYYPFLIGIEAEAEAQGFDLLLFTRAAAQGSKRRIYQDGISRLGIADGAILFGLGEDRDEIRRLAGEDFPFVFIGRREISGAEIAYVGADYTSATAEIVRHMFAYGHRKILYLSREVVRESVHDRERGYSLAYREAGLEPDPGWLLRLAPEMLCAELLNAWCGEGITAFIADNDSHARALLRLAAEQGMSPPQDFSLAVLGDPLDLRPGEALPEWTAFRVPRQEMGIHAVRLLIDQLEHPDTMTGRQMLLPCAFQPGSTVGPPPRKR